MLDIRVISTTRKNDTFYRYLYHIGICKKFSGLNIIYIRFIGLIISIACLFISLRLSFLILVVTISNLLKNITA